MEKVMKPRRHPAPAEPVDNPDWEHLRAMLRHRSGGRCEITGERLDGPDGWSVHHRQARGAGGTHNPAAHHLTNLLAVTGHGTIGSHGWIEHNRALARDHGWLVPHPVDPATVPVTLYSGRLVILTEYGGYTDPDLPIADLYRTNPLTGRPA